MTDLGADPDLEAFMASACRLLAGSENVDAITIAVRRQLTYEELVRLLDHAAPCAVAIVKDQHWTFTVRHRRTTRPTPRTIPEPRHGGAQ